MIRNTFRLSGRKYWDEIKRDLKPIYTAVNANNRQHRALGCKPIGQSDADLAMLMLPPVSPSLGWSETVRLPRDYYVRLDFNDYSVHPSAVGRRVEVSADLQTVTVACGGRVVACHARCWARRQCVADPEHRSRGVAHRAESSPARDGRGVATVVGSHRRIPPRYRHPARGVLPLVRRHRDQRITHPCGQIETWSPAIQAFIDTGYRPANFQ